MQEENTYSSYSVAVGDMRMHVRALRRFDRERVEGSSRAAGLGSRRVVRSVTDRTAIYRLMIIALVERRS
jgi:hypothetical protein